MNKKDTLHDQLNRPAAPENLEQNIRANWQDQLEHRRTNKTWHPSLAIAASVLLMVIVLNIARQTPLLVEAAIADIQADARHNIGLSIPIEEILTTHNIRLPDSIAHVDMTKNCRLNGQDTTHLRITNADQGEIHLFIYHGDFSTPFWQTSNGEVGDMPWKLISARDDLSVLVLQTPDVKPEHVNDMLKDIFVG